MSLFFSVLPELLMKLPAKRDYLMPLKPTCATILTISTTARDLVKRSWDSSAPLQKNYLLML